ncbi:MAG: ABC transporter ATP-binding protein [Candidatus Odinarchaeota archaeon]
MTKIFSGNKVALSEIDLSIVNGETVGILGNNGSGKTTLLRILATLLYPAYFTKFELFGLNPISEATRIKPLIGYLPERFSFYPYFTVNEVLDFFEQLQAVDRDDQEEHRERILKILGLDSYLDVRINALSKGMLHKVGLGITLIHDPPLLLLDEPTSGLDPLVRAQVRKILMDITADFDKTILLSSHILEDVEAICDRVFFLESGKMLHNEPFLFKDLKKRFSLMHRLSVRFNDTFTPPGGLVDLDNVLYRDVHPKGMEIYCKKVDGPDVIKQIKERLEENIETVFHPITLEDIYILNNARINWMDFLS